ncbi:MAG: preprotein translocase subunit YajC [Clostridiales bacterium]|nr:preprotein translocase subunit YajC [Clostridiales bacterium]
MSLLLAAETNVWNYVLIGVVVLLLIALPILMNARNKKESQKIQEQTNSLKVGDKILTTSGVYGTITELKFDDTQKMVVIETGGKTKSYMSIDAYAIYTVFKSEAELQREAALKAEAEKKAEEEKQGDKKVEKDSATEKAEEPKEETKVEVKEQIKKPRKKKTTAEPKEENK